MTSGWVGNLKAVVILVIVMVWRLKWRSCVLDKFDMVKVLYDVKASLVEQ